MINHQACVCELSELKGGKILKRGERDRSKNETKPPPVTSLRNRMPHNHPASIPTLLRGTTVHQPQPALYPSHCQYLQQQPYSSSRPHNPKSEFPSPPTAPPTPVAVGVPFPIPVALAHARRQQQRKTFKDGTHMR